MVELTIMSMTMESTITQAVLLMITVRVEMVYLQQKTMVIVMPVTRCTAQNVLIAGLVVSVLAVATCNL